MSNTHIPQLDGIRGIAILLVVVWHYLRVLEWPVEPHSVAAYIARCLSLSWSGVDLFFVLSGFLIGGILLDHRNSENYFSVFYARRFFRIVPLYVLTLAIGVVLDRPPASHLLWYGSFTQNVWMWIHGEWADAWLAQTWSLAVEEQFYLFLPLLIWFTRNKSSPVLLFIFVFLVLTAPALRVSMFLPEQHDNAFVGAHVLFPTRMDALLIGVLVAIVTRIPESSAWLSRHIRTLYLALAVLLLSIATVAQHYWRIGDLPMETIGLSIIGTLYGCFLLIAVLEKNGPISWLTGLAPMRILGLWAYCIYLIHGLVPQLLFQTLGITFDLYSWLNWALLGASFAIVLLLAAISWRYFEKPLITLGHRWRYELNGRSAPRRLVAALGASDSASSAVPAQSSS